MLLWRPILALLFHASWVSLSLAKDIAAPCNNDLNLSDLGKEDRYVLTSHGRFDEKTKYPAGKFCVRKLEKGRDCDAIKISCDFMDLEDGTRCKGDELTFDNGDDIEMTFCGSDVPPPFFSLSDKKMKVTFSSDDDANVGKGFRCYAECGIENCRCGIAKPVSKIVGGTTAEKNEWPWQVGMTYGTRKTFCGAVLIDHQTALTAAHCVERTKPKHIQLLLGEHDTSEKDDDAITVDVKEIISHPKYDRVTTDYDIAVLVLMTPIFFGDHEHIRPACLPTFAPKAGTDAVTTGWGTLSFGGRPPKELHEVDLQIVDQETCARIYYFEDITDNMLCAGAPGKDTCQGDSGGPLVVKKKDNYEIHGLTSFGYECAHPEFPAGVYANVYELLGWIKDKTGIKEDGCPRK